MMTTVTETLLALSQWDELAILGKATLILIVALTISYLARNTPAAIRHLVWTAACIALLLLPVLVVCAPELRIAVPAGAVLPGPVTAASPGPASASSEPKGDSVYAGRPAPGPSLPGWRAILLWVWTGGATLILASLALDLLRLRRIRRNGIPAPQWQALARTLASECGIRRPVELLLVDNIGAPLTSGFSRPAILLPEDARLWSEDDLRRALLHELEHVRRADWLTQLLARAACACYWFHPLAWHALRQLCLEAERACDDAVIEREDSTDYAEQLVALARRLSNVSMGPALGMAHRSDLSARVTAVLDPGRNRGRATVPGAVIALVLAGMLVAAIGPARAVAQTGQVRIPSSSAFENRPDRGAPTASDWALFQAADRGNTPEVERLISAGANVNARFDGDGSPLIAAARNGHDKTVSLLLDRGASLNMAVEGDGSPLIMAAANRHVSTVRLLLDRGADIHMPVPGDGNALIMGARGGSVEVVELLLARGANLEQVVPGDENALIEASASGHLPVVKLLVSRGANVNSRVWSEYGPNGGGEWRTPLGMARRKGHTAVAAFLQSAGARN